jgi:hypothetical protein
MSGRLFVAEMGGGTWNEPTYYNFFGDPIRAGDKLGIAIGVARASECRAGAATGCGCAI